jgi:hypothetical protein
VGGRLYSTIDEYTRDLQQPAHLNFNYKILRGLLPTAMSFTFLRSFNDFCRQFILSADRLDVRDVTDSYRAFQRYEKDLRELNDQFRQLRAIAEIDPRDLETLAVDQFSALILLPGTQQNQITDRDLQGALLANIDAFAIAAAEISFPPLLVAHADAPSPLNAFDFECLAPLPSGRHLDYLAGSIVPVVALLRGCPAEGADSLHWMASL